MKWDNSFYISTSNNTMVKVTENKNQKQNKAMVKDETLNLPKSNILSKGKNQSTSKANMSKTIDDIKKTLHVPNVFIHCSTCQFSNC